MKEVSDTVKYYNKFITYSLFLPIIIEFLLGLIFISVGVINIWKNLYVLIFGLIGFGMSYFTRDMQKNIIKTINIDKDKIEITFFVRKTIVLFKKDIYSYKKMESFLFYHRYIKISCKEGKIRIYEDVFKKYNDICYLLDEIVSEK